MDSDIRDSATKDRFKQEGNKALGAAKVVVVNGGGGNASDAALAEQETQTTALNAINAELDTQTTALQGIKTAVEQVGVDRYPNSSFFIATATPPIGTTTGDIIQNITIIDTSTNTTVADIWLNKDTGLALGSAPAIGTEVTYVGASGLTYEQLISAGLATQTTLAAVLAKIIAAPATEAKQDTANTLLTAISGYVDELEAKDYATQTTLAAVLAKIIAAPATAAKQDSLIALNAKTAHTEASGTITLGGTAQQLLAANAARVGILFQNISDTDMYLNTTGTATSGAGSYVIKANGGTYTTDGGVKDSLAISILCATTGKAFTCKWW